MNNINPDELSDLLDYYRDKYSIYNDSDSQHGSIHYKQSQLSILTKGLIMLLAEDYQHKFIDNSQNMLIELMFQEINLMVNGLYNIEYKC